MSKKKPNKPQADVHKELSGFDPKINEFGEIVSYDVNKINEFLNENVDDKKLREVDSENEAKLEEE